MGNSKKLTKNKILKGDSTLVNISEGTHDLTTPENIEKLESEMLTHEQAECSVRHFLGAGVYIREVSIPAGVFSVGHYQNFEHMNYMRKGRVIMLNDDGTTSELIAPVMFVGKPGRKVGFILEDMVWENIYPNPDNETDYDILEAKFVTKTESWLEDSKVKADLEYLSRHTDREDYKKMLIDVGASHETVVIQSENEDDQIPFPESSGACVKVSKSSIEGRGLFALMSVKDGEIIAPARINGMRTPAGRYTNHTLNPNAKMVLKENGDIDLVSIKNINGCSGGDSGEEVTICYRQAISLSNFRGDLCQE